MRTLVLVVLLVLFLIPVLTPAIAPALELPGSTASAAAVDGDDDNWSFWDWCVLWWTTHLGDWPD